MGRPKTEFGFVFLGIEIVNICGRGAHDVFDFGRSDIFGSTGGGTVDTKRFVVDESLETDISVNDIPHATDEGKLLVVVLLLENEKTGFAIVAIFLSTECDDDTFDLGKRIARADTKDSRVLPIPRNSTS